MLVLAEQLLLPTYDQTYFLAVWCRTGLQNWAVLQDSLLLLLSAWHAYYAPVSWQYNV